MTTLSGVWLPIVSPFHDGRVDFASYERLIEHYIGLGISGIFPLSTTGEGPALDDDEAEAIVERTIGSVAGRIPVFVGIGSNVTDKTLKLMRRLDRYDYPGIVSVCPYYNRPTQDGLFEHFNRIAAATDRQIAIYNIPYRTGVNLANDTLFALAERRISSASRIAVRSSRNRLTCCGAGRTASQSSPARITSSTRCWPMARMAASSPRHISKRDPLSRFTGECSPTTIAARARSGPGWKH
jgi:Dihydrodipicolinate synthetase family